jgi:hypothetical protein
VKLRVGYLPKQIVADAQLTARTDQQIRIRHEVGLQVLLEVLLGQHLLHFLVACALLHGFLHGFLHRLHDFPARTVAQRHHHGHGIVLGSMVHGFLQLILHSLWQTLHVADNTETHVVLHEDFILQ